VPFFWHVLLSFKEEKHERKTRLGEYFRAFFMEIMTNKKNPDQGERRKK